jgi:hypothetical protein
MPKGRASKEKEAAASSKPADKESSKAQALAGLPKPKRVPAKQVKRLERQLADATKAEAQRVRKLEAAHRRRQRIETAVDAARMAQSARLLWKEAAKQAASPTKARGVANAAKAAVPARPAAKTTAAPVAAKTAAKPAPARTAARPAARTTTPRPAARPAAARPAPRPAAAKPVAPRTVAAKHETKELTAPPAADEPVIEKTNGVAPGAAATVSFPSPEAHT